MTASPVITNQTQSLYDADYVAWIEATVDKLKQQAYSSVDWENLIEGIEDMGRSEKRSLTVSLRAMLLHFLRWQYQPECRTQSWQVGVVEHRIRIGDALQDSPSLKPYLQSTYTNAYRKAIRLAAIETGLSEKTFPVSCPYAINDILDDDFLPE